MTKLDKKKKNIKTPYSPLLFLSSLGAWWLSVSFFMYLMFMIPHPDTPIPTFNSLMLNINSIDTNIFLKILIILAAIGILVFALAHLKLLFWNIKEYTRFKKTDKYKEIKSTNAEVQLMTYPLTLAMTVNVAFIIWAIFVPNLWNIVEYLFPIALLAFLLVWIFALKIFWEYISRIITNKSFDFSKNNSLSQMISVFAFAMVWVWFWASAAMSHTQATAVLWLIWSIFFITIVIFFWAVKFILGFKSILRDWIDEESSPSLWIIIPILTLIWISIVRQSHWLEHNLNIWISSWTYFILTSILVSLQVIFWYLGYIVMKKNKYFKNYINWDKKSPWSFALICPWVASVVFWFFYVHLWLVKTWIIEKFWITYFILILMLFYLQVITINTFFKLKKKLL